MNLKKALYVALLAGAAGGLGSTAASAYVFTIDDFKVTRGGSAFFDDTFSDNVPPPSAPNFASGGPATYKTFGTFTESGGRAVMDQALVGPAPGIGVPDPFVGQRAVLQTDKDSTNTTDGLKQNFAFSVEGLFDLVIPTQLRTAYGVRVSDRIENPDGTAVLPGNDIVEVEVIRNQANQLRVNFTSRDGVADTMTVIASITLAPLAGDDQILLKLNHAANSQDISASFNLLDNGVITQTRSFTTAGNPLAQIFDGETWTQASFFAFTPEVPEPGTLALLGLGSAVIGFGRRRQGAGRHASKE